MGFGLVHFTGLAVRIGTGRIEVPQGDKVKVIRLMKILQYGFYKIFGMAVGIYRADRM